jgi:mannosyl-glycoprotein endo-beta-N-acetylglucosaminidase
MKQKPRQNYLVQAGPIRAGSIIPTPRQLWGCLLTGLVLLGTLTAAAQVTGDPVAPQWKPAAILNWSSATDPDAPFNRSLVPLAERFIHPTLNPNAHARTNEGRVMPLVAFNRLPASSAQGSRSVNYYSPNYWQYMHTFCFWGGSDRDQGVILCPNAHVIDAAHRNGVPVLGKIFFGPGVYGGQIQYVNDFLQKSGTNYPVADKLIEASQYFGFDGWFINQETEGASAATATAMTNFLAYCKARAPQMRMIWYDSMDRNGNINYRNALDSYNQMFFQSGSTVVSTNMFLNFWWSSAGLTSARSLAQSLGRNPYDLYAGIDTEGGGYGTTVNWTALFPEGQAHKMSLGIYRPEWTFNSSSGLADFHTRDNRYWAGPDGDPTRTYGTNAWPGIAHFIPAASPVTTLPFVSSFNSGVGTFHNVNGQRVLTGDWNNLSLQDILPTWRWLLRSGGTRLLPEFSWSESYFGGSSLKLSGTLDATNDLQLFQTSLLVATNTQLRVAFKTGSSGAATRGQLSLAFADAPGVFEQWDLGNTTNAGWNLKQFSLAARAGRRISVVGLRCAAATTVSNYVLRVGQIALFNSPATPPAPPANLMVTQLNQIDPTNASLRLAWTPSASPVFACNLYRRNADNTLTWLGATPNRVYFAPNLKRAGNEAAVTLEVEAVGPDFTLSTHAVTDLNWQSNTVVYSSTHSPWKFLDTGANLGTLWRTLNYNDNSWPSGAGQLGFGDGDETTLVASNQQMTTYFRQRFVAAAGTCTNLVLRLLRDDGAAVYLNGVEVFRSNLPADPLTYTTAATNALAADESTTFYSVTLPGSHLLTGTNILAVELHQNTATSSDLSFNLELAGQHAPGTPLLSVANEPPGSLSKTGAVLRGAITVLNAPAADAVLFLGPADGGTDPAAWAMQIPLGPRGYGSFASTVTNLLPGTTYYVRCRASNALAAAWASSSLTFTTAPATLVTLVTAGSVWRFEDSGRDLGAAWRTSGFVDAGWRSGAAMLGFGDANGLLPVTTVSNNHQVTTYFRRAFYVPDATRVLGLTARLVRDDGAAVYLNGTAIWRDNLPTNTTILFDTVSSTLVSAADEATFFTRSLAPTALVSGTNILAVEIHQNTNTSSDVSFDFELTAQVDFPAPPRLALRAGSANQLSLSGPLEAGFCALYLTTNLTPPQIWVRGTNPPTLSNGQWTVTVPRRSQGQEYYRLQSE